MYNAVFDKGGVTCRATSSHRRTLRLTEAAFALLPPAHLWKGTKVAPLTVRFRGCRRLCCSKRGSFRMFTFPGLHIPPPFPGAVTLCLQIPHFSDPCCTALVGGSPWGTSTPQEVERVLVARCTSRKHCKTRNKKTASLVMLPSSTHMEILPSATDGK